MEESKTPRIRIATNLKDQTMTLQNLSDGPIWFEFASIKGLEGIDPVKIDAGTMLAIRLTAGVALAEPEATPPASS